MIFYHNITTLLFNETDVGDLAEEMTSLQDNIWYTQSGDAILKPLTDEMRYEIRAHFERIKDC